MLSVPSGLRLLWGRSLGDPGSFPRRRNPFSRSLVFKDINIWFGQVSTGNWGLFHSLGIFYKQRGQAKKQIMPSLGKPVQSHSLGGSCLRPRPPGTCEVRLDRADGGYQRGRGEGREGVKDREMINWLQRESRLLKAELCQMPQGIREELAINLTFQQDYRKTERQPAVQDKGTECHHLTQEARAPQVMVEAALGQGGGCPWSW